MWAVLVTGGTVIEYPPELYLDGERAEQEARRWAWILSGAGWRDVEQPFPGRWSVGESDVRLVLVEAAESTGSGEWWVGTFWDRSGLPDPEALVFGSRNVARAWVFDAPYGAPPVDTQDLPWLLAATYLHRGEGEYAVAHLAKLVS